MKYLRVGIPVLVVFACMLNGLLAYSSDNGMAVAAYITALCGWLVVALDEYLTFRREHRSV